jgi:SAM-dependent methyltransferase
VGDSEFWEHSDQVEKFASREPDRRLVELIRSYPVPSAVRTLDLGCAGGRNTELLAERGFDVHAVDTSYAMVARTRERLARVIGDDLASRRVRVVSMDDLSVYPDGAFLLVVALGVHHNARSRAEWDRALEETARVLAPGGLLLSSNFSPQSDLTGEGITPVDGEPGVYDGLPSGRHTLFEAPEHDAEMARFGLSPREPTQTVVVDLEVGRRVSVNGLYVKRSSS